MTLRCALAHHGDFVDDTEPLAAKAPDTAIVNASE